MGNFTWEDGVVDPTEYDRLNVKILFVLQEPYLSNENRDIGAERLSIIKEGRVGGDFDELAFWLHGLYEKSKFEPKCYKKIIELRKDLHLEDERALLEYRSEHLSKCSFLYLKKTTTLGECTRAPDLKRYLEDRDHQSRIRKEIIDSNAAIIVYCGATWVHNILFYKHKWHPDNDITDDGNLCKIVGATRAYVGLTYPQSSPEYPVRAWKYNCLREASLFAVRALRLAQAA